jgi:tetratricopeptide (TPR) repeat protein
MSPRSIFFSICAAFIAPLGTPAATPHAPDSWTGERVLGKKPNNEITFRGNENGKQVKFEFRGVYPIRVRDDRDGSLRIFDGHREGWAKKSDFVLTRDAPAYFTDVIRANPADSFALTMRGLGWLYRGEYDNAIKDFTECIRIDAGDADAFDNRGATWLAKKDYDRAIRDFDEAIRLDPKKARSFNNRGNARQGTKDYDRAIRDYDDAIRLDPKFAQVFNNRGNARQGTKDYDRAIRDYDEAIRLDPNYALAFMNRAGAWSEKKDYDRAIRDYDEAIRLDPKNAQAFDARGDAWCDKKDYGRAIRDYDEAIRLDPGNADAFNGRAWLAATCPDAKYRDGAKAVSLAQKAIELAGTDADWYFSGTLAAAYAETGDFHRAVAEQEKVLSNKDLDGEDRAKAEKQLALYRDRKPFRDDD